MVIMWMVFKLVVILLVLSDLAEFVGGLIDIVVPSKIKLLGVIKSLVVYLLTCNKCFSFWFSLIWSGDLFASAVVAMSISFIMSIKSRYLGSDVTPL
jgi:hypothetical protein